MDQRDMWGDSWAGTEHRSSFSSWTRFHWTINHPVEPQKLHPVGMWLLQV